MSKFFRMKTHYFLLISLSVLLASSYSHQQHSSHDHRHHDSQQDSNPQSEPSHQQPDDTDNMMALSKLIISTIQKYDPTEKGVIPLKRYDEFLHEIFINGNKFNKLNKNGENVPDNIANLLKKATTDFKEFRYSQPVHNSNQQQSDKQPQQKQFVELQEFYMDLIKHFSEFLSLEQYKEKYQEVSDFFFVQHGTNQQETTGNQPNGEENKIQL